MNLPAEAERVPGGADLVHAVLIGGDVEALAWVPRLFRDPQINLLGLLPVHPADLVRNLDAHGYALCDPGPLAVFAGVAELAALPRLDLIIDTTLDPATVRHLGEAGLGGVPRVNSGALGLLLARPGPGSAPAPAAAAPAPGAFTGRVAKELGRAYRHGRTLGLIRVEVGGDGAGGPLPDPVADQVTQAIEQSLRIEDVVARVEPGVFAVLLPETGDATRHVAARLTSNLAELRIRGVAATPAGAGREGADSAGTEGAQGGDADGGSPRQTAPGVRPRLRHAVGWAWFPHDAKTAQALMDQARTRMGPPSSLGP